MLLFLKSVLRTLKKEKTYYLECSDMGDSFYCKEINPLYYGCAARI